MLNHVMSLLQGTSRGGANVPDIVKRLKLWGVNQLFVVGGNGGNAAANAIHEECEKQGHVCSVVGVPKSIDNDILLVRCKIVPQFPSRSACVALHLLPWHAAGRSGITGHNPCQ